MPNIYIRLLSSRCQFIRNREQDRSLEPWEPIKYSAYSEEHYIIKSSIYNKRTAKADIHFFSQQEWNNMLCGRDPNGKSMQRNKKSQWLEYDEIKSLFGEKVRDKSEKYDYLCIKLPNEVFSIDSVRNVTPTYCIDSHGYAVLSELINNDFKRSLVDWAVATFDHCISNGQIILRGRSAMLERYLIRYNIDATQYEKDNLRRIINRWLRENHSYYDSYSSIDLNYTDKQERKLQIKGVEWI